MVDGMKLIGFISFTNQCNQIVKRRQGPAIDLKQLRFRDTVTRWIESWLGIRTTISTK